MFNNEKELVEKLVLDLQARYNTEYIVRELRGGNNIADVVYTTSLERENVVFDEYLNAYCYFNEIYNKKRIPLKEFKTDNQQTNKKINHFLRDLEQNGYIKINNDYITVIKKVNAVSKNIVAIEAKLSDWKAGLNQAIRYKRYADEVYVAISSEYVKNVDKSQFRELNIGLMSVSNDKLKISVRAKRERVQKLDVKYFMADRFLKQLNLSK